MTREDADEGMPKISAIAVTCAVVLCGCSTGRSRVTELGVGQEFPHSESFYPLESQRAGQEGIVTVGVCVDVAGKLSDSPVIAVSSGNLVLDAAALDLAEAGSGHYRPARQNGIAVPGCGSFQVNFKLWTDPRWPTLARKLRVIDAALLPRSDALRSLLVAPPDRSRFIPGDIEQLRQLRQSARSVSEALDRVDDSLTDYFASIDRLGTEGDIPQAERVAFRAYWPARRDVLRVRVSEMLSAARNCVRVMDELGNYIESTQPPLASPSGPVTPTAVQRSELDAIFQRGEEALVKLRGAIVAWSEAYNQSHPRNALE